MTNEPREIDFPQIDVSCLVLIPDQNIIRRQNEALIDYESWVWNMTLE